MDDVRIECRTTERERELARTLSVICKTPQKAQTVLAASGALVAEIDKRQPKVPGPYRRSPLMMLAYVNGWRPTIEYKREYAFLEPDARPTLPDDDGTATVI